MAAIAAGGQQARTYTLQVNAQEIVLDLVVTDVKANSLPTSSETIFRSMRTRVCAMLSVTIRAHSQSITLLPNDFPYSIQRESLVGPAC
jgi:hypothetical protein